MTKYNKVVSCNFNGYRLNLLDSRGEVVESWERDHNMNEKPSEFLDRIEETVKLFDWDLSATRVMAKFNGWK